ncbi:hypothetical protein [Clostridium aminobutyricum]|uniref:Uncharacterized protein n=1 Tax=Clostridium aminobutyricum TaxID=33953 RepID=A0A939D8N5_CLOAM|nr:hypothetical protein [Clostridium aminobutyricum]MBN7773107.1 hypothetical protein [Clostridium aminobutyricum]
MEFYFKAIGSDTHLFREDGFFDEDLGKLTKTFTGKLRTNKLFGETFELEDISGVFSKGERYSIKSSKGLKGVMEKKAFSGRYVFK